MRPSVRASVLLVGVLLLWATTAVAQTPLVNPTKVLFDSVNHTVACPADSCIVSYTVELWISGVDPTTGSPISSATLDKAAVTSTGSTPAYRALLQDCTPPIAPPAGQVVVLRMIANGPYVSSARSLPSGPFVKATPPASPANLSLAP